MALPGWSPRFSVVTRRPHRVFPVFCQNAPGMESDLLQSEAGAPTNEREAAIIARLAPAAYTAILRGQGSTTGLGLVEIYNLDATGSTTSSLVNISSRGAVSSGDSVLIGGFILSGDANVLLRATGPSLIPFGVEGALLDPTMEVYDGAGNLIAANDNRPVRRRAIHASRPSSSACRKGPTRWSCGAPAGRLGWRWSKPISSARSKSALGSPRR